MNGRRFHRLRLQCNTFPVPHAGRPVQRASAIPGHDCPVQRAIHSRLLPNGPAGEKKPCVRGCSNRVSTPTCNRGSSARILFPLVEWSFPAPLFLFVSPPVPELLSSN